MEKLKIEKNQNFFTSTTKFTTKLYKIGKEIL